MEQDTGFEPALSVWKTDVLAANTNPAYVAFLHRRLTVLEVKVGKVVGPQGVEPWTDPL